MQSSKINQLRQSSFREHRKKDKRDQIRISQLPPNESYSGPQQALNLQSLLDYQLKLPICPFHHQPIRHLCLKQDCQSSTFGVCNNEQCRSLHSDPDADLIELKAFNEVIRQSCSSLQLLTNKLKQYFKEVKDQLMHKIDRSIDKALYLVENIYLQEVPKLIKQKRHAEINSAKLGSFIRKEVTEGPAIRNRMQALRNRISERITDREAALDRFYASKDFENIILGDLIRAQQKNNRGEGMNKLYSKDFVSSILTQTEETELLIRLLRQNRAISFNKINPIFRASSYHFSSSAMHRVVDGIAPTLFLVKTTSGKKFGAYLNCKLNDREEWIPDVTGLSFIFSIDREESYRLKAQAHSRLKAAFGGGEGVQIGSGCDLYLCQSCHVSQNNGSNLGGSYRLPGHLEFNTSRSRSYLAGEESFLVAQYQFFCFQ